jgi:hypothetical protein
MRSVRVVALIVGGICAVPPCVAQHNEAPIQHQEQALRGIDALRETASSKTEFTLDHSMLVFASKLDPGDEDLRRVIAGVSGVTVHSFRYPRPGMYTPEALDSLKDEHHTGGWTHVVNNHRDSKGATADVWVRMENNAVSNIAVLMTRASEVDYVVASGSISPMDLSHLGGHFGIPKIEGGVMVPERK